MSSQNPWYKLEPAEILSQLGADATRGLTEAEASRHLAECGPNELIERGAKTALTPGP